MANKNVFLTDGNGIYKLDRFIKAAVLVNLETQEQVTALAIGSQVAGFAIIKLPEVGEAPKKTASQRKPAKIRGRKKSSKYYGVSKSLHSKKNPWRAMMWVEGKNVSLGRFPTEEAAAQAVDDELIKRGKPTQNFPQARTEG